MYHRFKKELHTLSAAVSAEWNWRTLRPAANPVFPTDNLLSDTSRDFMAVLGGVVGGSVIIHGGALNDLVSRKTPKDFDGFMLTRFHPLWAAQRIEKWAQSKGYRVISCKRRVRLLWKQVAIETEHGIYDLTCLQGKMTLLALLRQMADEADVSPCARAATVDEAYQSQRCIDGEERGELIFRPLGSALAQSRHFDRWLKYAIAKYPERSVVYQDIKEAALFAELNVRRAEIQDRYATLCAADQKPKNFEPFVPLFSELHAKICALARVELKV